MNIDELRAVVSKEPGNTLFATLADQLRLRGETSEAFTVCFAGLSANPSNTKGRLILARLFCEQGHVPFAIRELELLREQLPNNKPLLSLLERLTPDTAPTKGVVDSNQALSTFAEAEFSFDDLALLEDDK